MKNDLLRDLYGHDDGIPASLRNLLREQELSFSEKVNMLLRGIFACDTSIDDSNILESYTQRFVSVSQGAMREGAESIPVNTYPFGIKTTDVFPEFVGICADDLNLRSALKAIKVQCDKMCQMLSSNQEKTIVLLTDKWDGPVFKKQFELSFLNYALNYNVLFVFLLVTDYGISRIPFLAQNRFQLEMLSKRGYDIEQTDVGTEALKLLNNFSPCIYRYRSGTWAAPGSAEFHDDTYLFDFKAKICEITNAYDERIRKKIPNHSAHRFALSVYPFFGQEQQAFGEPTRVLDAGACTAEVFGVRFDWPCIGTDFITEPNIKIVSSAFAKLIASLKEM